MGTILVIDDEPGIRNTVKDILEDEKYKVLVAEDGLIGLGLLKQEMVDVIILDVWLPRMGGIDVLKAVKADYPHIEVIVVSGHASIDMAVSALKLGAFDFIEKPLTIERLTTTTRNACALSGLRTENRKLKNNTVERDELLGSSSVMQEVKSLIEQSAKSDARILITGENGTGKELAARMIHEKSQRVDGPFVAVNCAALPDTLIESELFGHEKGAFTDAVARRKGKFEIAHTGTLFLDEIADMSLSAQAKVLRVIQEMKFERLGGESTIDVDVRIIAATNKDLQKEIQEGNFREDLFFRLNVIPIHMPALRQKTEDIPELANSFLHKMQGSENRHFSQESVKLLLDYRWPGNIRELKNFVERVSVMSDEENISSETVSYFLKSVSSVDSEAKTSSNGDNDMFEQICSQKYSEAKDSFERNYLLHNLERFGYNVARTAEYIGVYPSNLHAKIKKYGIEVAR